jgi:hypothetical protein
MINLKLSTSKADPVLNSAQPWIKVEVQLETFLTLAIDKGVISFTPGEELPVSTGRTPEPIRTLQRREKPLVPARTQTDPGAIQHLA